MSGDTRSSDGGTVMEFQNAAEEVIAIHNNARDSDAANVGQAGGMHW